MADDVKRDSVTGFPLVQPGSLNAADLANQASSTGPQPGQPEQTQTAGQQQAATQGPQSVQDEAAKTAAASSPSPVTSAEPPLFVERKDQVFYTDFIIYCAGVDVTAWVMGSLKYTYSNRNGWNTVNFSLQNAEDNFVLNDAQAQSVQAALERADTLDTGLFRTIDTDVRYSERAKLEILRKKVLSRLNVKDKETGAFRWEMNPNSTCFSKHDPIRVFVHHPLIAEADDDTPAWLPAFCGYLENRTQEDDYINGQRSVSVTGYDIRAFLKRQRLSTNWSSGMMGGNPFIRIGDEIFNDLRSGTRYGQPLQLARPFEDAVLLLITGRDRKNATAKKKRFEGVGNFSLGKVFEFSPVSTPQPTPRQIKAIIAESKRTGQPAPDVPTDLGVDQKKVLEQWYHQALYGEWKFPDGSTVSGRPLTLKEVRKIGENTFWDHHFAPDNQKVYFLVPKGGTGNRSFLDASSGQTTPAHDTSWTSRHEVIQTVCSALDYQWFVSGAGDMFFAFNMLDFQPDDFGEKIAPVLKVDKHLIRSSISDEYGEIPSLMIATGGHGLTNVRGDSRILLRRAAVYVPLFVRRYGINTQNQSYPFVGSTKVLRALAAVALQKAVANANTMDVDFAYRPLLIPNVPFLNRVRTRIGTIESITHSMQVFGECTTQVHLQHVRQRLADGRYRMLMGGLDTVIRGRRLVPGDFIHGGPDTGMRTDADLEKDRSSNMEDPPPESNKLPSDIKNSNFED